MDKSLPTGTVTFLFSDIEGNTPRWERNPVAMEAAMQVHNRVLREAIRSHAGMVFKIVGDEFQSAFPTAPQALAAALDAQRGLSASAWNELGPLKARIGIHTGEAHLDDYGDEYAVSHTKNRGHRVMEAGHGGQILLSKESAVLCESVLPQEIILKDLGQYHLKGLTRLEQIFQVVAPDLQENFPPLRTMDTSRHNLPLQLTSFIGREEEIEAVKAYLSEDPLEGRPRIPSRLVTLTGVGGTGKTRLALQVAAELVDEFPDGLWMVEFARISDPVLIAYTAAAVFGLRDEMGRSAAEMLDSHLRLKRLLLILDNCEHLIEGVARFADHLLHLAPGVKILATSREALGLTGETIYPVPSLGTPSPANPPPLDSLTQYEAVQLFIDRAVAILPAFRVTNANAPAVAQICYRLDGIPLAIELAAARVKALSVDQIADRLNDRFRLLSGGSRNALPRQRTLQATIDWSYGLLTEAERALFRCLSVFTGSWTLEAAEAVSAGASGLDPASVLDLLSQLVNKSMVVADVAGAPAYRYRMLETIRQYAQEKLIEAGEAAKARNQHLAYFLAFAEEMGSQFETAEQISAFGQLDREINHIRSAVDWAFGDGSGNSALLGLRLVNATGWYLELKTIPESIEWLKKGLSLLQGVDKRTNRVRAEAYLFLGVRYGDSDFPEAKRWLHESVSLNRRTGDLHGLALALALLGMLHANLDPLRNAYSMDLEAAWACCKESELICREIHNSWGMRWVYVTKSCIYNSTKDYASLKQMEEEHREVFQDSESRIFPEFYYASLLGMAALERADYPRVYFYFRRYMELSRKLCVKGDEAFGLWGMGIGTFTQGDLEKAVEHFKEAALLFRETGFDYYTNWSLRCLSTAVLARGQVERARNCLLESLPEEQEKKNASAMLFFLTHAAGVIAAEGHPVYAAKLLGMIDVQYISIPTEGRNLGHDVFLQWIITFVRTHFDEAAFVAAWAEGKKLTLDQAMDEVNHLLNEKPAV